MPGRVANSEGKVTGGKPEQASRVSALGLTEGLVVQEIGWDDDVDEDFRAEVMDAIDADLVEEAVEAVDVVVLWLRDDADVVDSLVDALRDLSRTGYIWAVTPKVGRPGHVDPADLAEGAKAAGLALTTSVGASHDWSAHKLVRPRKAPK